MSALQRQIADLLGRLSTLSEAKAGNLEAHIGRSAPDSTIPGGANLRDLSDHARRARSLFDWYRAEFARRADEPDRLLSLYLAGEREYLRRVDRETHNRTAEKGSILAYSQKGHVVEAIAGEQVVREFEGVAALDVAIIEGKTEAWVRKVRRQHDRNPEDGRPRAEFLGFDEARRTATVHRLAEQLETKQAVADRLGVDRETVSRYWPMRAGRIAA